MFLALLLLSTIPIPLPVVRDEIGIAERNIVYDLDGNEILRQWIFSDEFGRIMAWKMDRDNAWQHHPPRLVWVDDAGRIREVKAKSWLETWEQFDREIAQRETLPVCQRRGLSK